MHAAPYRPSRMTWTWLLAAIVAIVVLSAAALSMNGGNGCKGGASLGRSGSHNFAGGHNLTTAQHTGAPTPPGATPGSPDSGQVSTTAHVASGMAHFYVPGRVAGSCALGPFPPGGDYVSLPPGQYRGGAACGSYLQVHGPRGVVQAEVVDLCPSCRPAMINLSRAAFVKIANPRPGSARVTYWAVRNPKLPGPIAVRAVGGASAGAIAVQILNHGNLLTSVAVAPDVSSAAAGGPGPGASPDWHTLVLTGDDFWVSGRGLGAGPFELRITDDLGHQVVLSALALEPGTTTQSRVWMYRASAPAHRATPRPTPTQQASAHC